MVTTGAVNSAVLSRGLAGAAGTEHHDDTCGGDRVSSPEIAGASS
jgi:hypothetical protein